MQKITQEHKDEAARIRKLLDDLDPRVRYCLADVMSFGEEGMTSVDALDAIIEMEEYLDYKEKESLQALGSASFLKDINMKIVKIGDVNQYKIEILEDGK